MDEISAQRVCISEVSMGCIGKGEQDRKWWAQVPGPTLLSTAMLLCISQLASLGQSCPICETKGLVDRFLLCPNDRLCISGFVYKYDLFRTSQISDTFNFTIKIKTIFQAKKDLNSIVLLDLFDCICLIRHGLLEKEQLLTLPRVSLYSHLLPTQVKRVHLFFKKCMEENYELRKSYSLTNSFCPWIWGKAKITNLLKFWSNFSHRKLDF